MDLTQISVPLLATFAVGGVLYVFVYPLLSGDAKAEKRKAALQTRSPVQAALRVNDAAKRRKHVTDSLKEIDARAKNKKISIETKLTQAGLDWTKKKFITVSVIMGIVLSVTTFVLGGGPIMTFAMAMIGGFGLPAWYIKHLKNRRIKKFVAAFPPAVDIIVRGIKAGIPLGDCIRNIASEAAEPVKSEFRSIVEAQTMGPLRRGGRRTHRRSRADTRGQLLLHRDQYPSEGRRQSRGGFEQPVERAA